MTGQTTHQRPGTAAGTRSSTTTGTASGVSTPSSRGKRKAIFLISEIIAEGNNFLKI